MNKETKQTEDKNEIVELTPEIALNNLDMVASMAQVNRHDHVVVQQSVQVLKKALGLIKE